MVLPEIGRIGQEKLAKSRVLIIGLGGLGSAASFYLACAGIGNLGIVDFDKVKLDNLNRQILYWQNDLGGLKVELAQDKLKRFNKDIKIIPYNLKINKKNVLNIIKDYDIIIDATDNFATRYLINDSCVISNKPLIHGSVSGWNGQITTILPHQGPCYRCLFPKPPKTNSFISKNIGIVGVVAATIGVLQANEAIKFILNYPGLLIGELLFFNTLDNYFNKVEVIRDINCKLCGKSNEVL